MMTGIDNQIYVCKHIEVKDSTKVEEGSVAKTNKQTTKVRTIYDLKIAISFILEQLDVPI